MKLATLFPDHAPSGKVVNPVYFGGPEMLGAIFAIVQRDPGVPSLRLFGDVFVTGNSDAVDRIIEQTPNDARYFAGFVGWQTGELAKLGGRLLVRHRPRPGARFQRRGGRRNVASAAEARGKARTAGPELDLKKTQR